MKIVIPGTPIAKKRHKCGCRGNKPFAYDPQLKQEMEAVKWEMLSAFDNAINSKNKEIVVEASNLTVAKSFEVTYDFLFPVKKSETKVKRMAKLAGLQPHNIKPDLDNLEKFYTDCATGIFWTDDCQITVMSSKKSYDDNPRTEMEIIGIKPRDYNDIK